MYIYNGWRAHRVPTAPLHTCRPTAHCGPIANCGPAAYCPPPLTFWLHLVGQSRNHLFVALQNVCPF